MPVCALADTAVSVPSGWQATNFTGTVGGPSDANAIDFTTAAPVLFTVVDCCELGDEYSVFNGATFLGDTSAVPTDASVNCGGDPELCLAENFSNATFLLGPGTYAINIYQTVAPFGAAGAFYDVYTPEPGSLTLFGTGLLGLIGVARRRLGKKA